MRKESMQAERMMIAVEESQSPQNGECSGFSGEPLPVVQSAIIGDKPGESPENVVRLAGTPVFEGYWMATLSGNDAVVGSNAADIIEGGDQADILMGSNGDDLIYGTDKLIDPLQEVPFWQASGLRGDWASGGLGDDLVVGSAGNDALLRVGKSQSAWDGDKKTVNDYEWRRVA